MSTVLRTVLVIGSVCFMVYLISDLRKTKISVDMSVIWVIISCLIVIMAIFPQPLIYLTGVLGIQSPVNGVLVFFILILLLLVFYLSKKISRLEFKLREIAHEIGINDLKNKKDNRKY